MTKPDDQEAILYSFAVEEKHDRNTLERYLEQYPELAEELIDLSSELRLSKVLGPSPADAPTDAGWEAAWKGFLACKPEEACKTKESNPFAQFRGEAFARLATRLNVPRVFLQPLRDSIVAASSVPVAFVRKLALAMGASVESLQTHLSEAQPTLDSLSFKSEGKPHSRAR